MSDYRVTHNGMDINNFGNLEQVNSYIQGVLANHSNLRPELVFSRKEKRNPRAPKTQSTFGVLSVTIIIYQYYTLYQEVFYVEESIN